MDNKVLNSLLGGFILYVIASVAYQAGRDSVEIPEPIVVHETGEVSSISADPPQKVGKIGLFLGLKKAFGGAKQSGLKDLLSEPDSLHMESYYEDGVLKVNIRKRTA